LAENGQKKEGENVVATRRGYPVYLTNPSVPSDMPVRRRRIEIPGGKGALLVDGASGEVLGRGAMAFLQEEEVDTTRFVKVFLDGIRQVAGLSKAAMQVFEFVYAQMRQHPGTDKIEINLLMAERYGLTLSERTFNRGMQELMQKEFLYKSASAGVFFVNIRYMFNGDRLAFVKSYRLKGTETQTELPFDAPRSLPAPENGK